MAGEDLFASLYDTGYAPVETGWGIAAQGVASALPSLVNPYGSTGTNIATTLGGALLAGLLGYQARASADERNAAQAQYIPELFSSTTTPERRAAIFAEEPRLAKVYKGLALQKALQGIELETARKTEEMKAQVAAQKEVAVDLGVPFDQVGKGGQVATPAAGTSTGQYTYLGKKAEDELKDVQKTFSNTPEYKNYQYTKGTLERLSQGVMKTDAVSDVDFAKGAIQAIEPGLATQRDEILAITQSPSIPEALKASMANAAEGTGKLTPKIRAQILGIVENAYKTQAANYQDRFDFYKNEAVTKSRRPELSDEIGQRIAAGGIASPYEDIVQKWFKVPGVDLGEYSAADIIKQLAAGNLEPDTLIRGLQQPGEAVGRATAAVGPTSVSVDSAKPVVVEATPAAQPKVEVLSSPTSNSKMVQALATPTATPVAMVAAQPVEQPRAVVVQAQPQVVKAAEAPAPEKVTREQAAADLKRLMAKGKDNWSMSDRARYAELFSMFGGR
jgi:hypothetical protein